MWYYGVMPEEKERKTRFNEWYEKHERTVSSAAFIGGFVLDNFTLSRIDRFFDMFVMFFWFTVAGASIVALNLSLGKSEHRNDIFRFFIQIAFGSLFSGFTVMYMRSGSFTASFPFLTLVILLFIGNEFFRKRYLRLTFQVSILFTALFFFMIYCVPIFLGKMGVWVFLLSGAASILVVAAFASLLLALLPRETHKSKTALIQSIVGIFIVVNILYFTNLIPPIPLSLKDAGPYHSLTKSEAGKETQYLLGGEQTHWYDFFRPHQEIHILYGEPVYFYSAVFAPTKLSVGIAHRWQYYDVTQGKWIPSGTFPFGITGGRDTGYRGYSEKTNIRPGLWRVDVITDRGQVIGRTKFMVIEVPVPVALETRVR